MNNDSVTSGMVLGLCMGILMTVGLGIWGMCEVGDSYMKEAVDKGYATHVVMDEYGETQWHWNCDIPEVGAK